MGRERFMAEQIIGKLREAESLLAKGQNVVKSLALLALTGRPITAGAKSTVD